VSLEYDPLLAKLVVHAGDRAAAIERARRALAEWSVLGVETNAPVLDAVLESTEFRSGRYATDLVAKLARSPRTPPPDEVWIAAALALSERGPRRDAGVRETTADDPWSTLQGFRAGGGVS
jgi:acetyl/propionyl-CoA carboxylase alpha subunit